MSKFIFVCYKNGCGGEQLALKISKINGCVPLGFNKHGKRIVVKDVFNSNLLKAIPAPGFTPDIINSHGWNVVLSHRCPDILQNIYPNSMFVVIKMPESDIDIKKLILRKYKYFELSARSTFVERLGGYKDYGGDMTDKKKIKQLAKPLKNIEIQCLVQGLEFNRANFRKIFLDKINRLSAFPYTPKENVIVIDFIDVYNNNIHKLFKKISNWIGVEDK